MTVVAANRVRVAVAAVVLSFSTACASSHPPRPSTSPALDELKADIAMSMREPAQASSLCTYRFGHDLGDVIRTSESEYNAGEYGAAIEDAKLLKRASQVCSHEKGVWLSSATMFADDVLIKSYIAKGQREESRRYSQEALANAKDVLADAGASRATREAANRVSRLAKSLAPSE